MAPLTVHHLVAFAHAVNDGRTAQEYDPKEPCSYRGGHALQMVDENPGFANIKTRKHQNAQTRKHQNAQTCLRHL